MALETGDLVPSFSVPQDNGRPYVPQPGRWRVLFFFPKTATTHCQLQARRYAALQPQLEALGADVVGINGDPRRDQVQFRGLCELNYPLLDDSRHDLSRQFGVLEEPWPGETVRRPRRDTFLVSPDGVIVQHWREVDPGRDAETVLEALRTLVA
ncbi:peroxiredoxin [Deinococcus koreensis]|uniref:thioredoxin-dependent peroxiredoxin n=1 Tax=Deinococcus koreensis TaxID=2054903 RepID=A0A2K3USD5_9DEIO|nr:peroxiredoxin [Deinococcus koreensis]PNY79462.1 peroxiredoxin [Deinococcus koreensis]